MSVERPHGLSASAFELWDTGLPSTDLHAGDLWILSWDGQTVGHALIAAVKGDYVLVWPVTLPGEPSFAPGLLIDSTPLGVPLTVWPTRETGIGNHLLDRNLGRLLEPERIPAVAAALEDAADPGLHVVDGLASDPANGDADRAMIEHWADLCFNTGGVAECIYLNPQAVKASGADSRRTSELLGMPIGKFVEVWKGISEVTSDQIETLARELGVEADSLVTRDPYESVLTRLASPAFKRQIEARLHEVEMDETDFRRAVRAEFALAARDDSQALTDRKLLDAIQRAGR